MKHLMPMSLVPLSQAPLNEWSGLRFILTDIDDTLTTDGRLSASVYAMIERLRDFGLAVIPVTGRPAGWCDMIARFWPVDAVVGENGAFYFRYDHERRAMTRVFSQSIKERAQNRQLLARIREEVLRVVPNAAVATDQGYREADLAIDFAEDVNRLPDQDIDKIVAIFEASGAIAKVSSIHVNGWFGDHDKLSMTKKLLREEFGVAAESAEGQDVCTFIGDAPNDAPMFRFFRKSVGVANIAAFADRCAVLPKWITPGEGGEGFCAFAACILASIEQNTS